MNRGKARVGPTSSACLYLWGWRGSTKRGALEINYRQHQDQEKAHKKENQAHGFIKASSAAGTTDPAIYHPYSSSWGGASRGRPPQAPPAGAPRLPAAPPGPAFAPRSSGCQCHYLGVLWGKRAWPWRPAPLRTGKRRPHTALAPPRPRRRRSTEPAGPRLPEMAAREMAGPGGVLGLGAARHWGWLCRGVCQKGGVV